MAKPAEGAKPSAFWENVRTILYALALAMSIRFAIAQPFRIPSGSMQPTLMVGDYIVVTKWSYGYSRFSFAPLEGLFPRGRLFADQPERGDIIVFRPPTKPNTDFVKRLIGLPGDVVEVRQGQVILNGVPVAREYVRTRAWMDRENGASQPIEVAEYRETLPNGVTHTTFDRFPGTSALDEFGPVTVPAGHYFLMGDDRDNSSDSRVPSEVGFVPFDHLVGQAQFVALSFSSPLSVRFDRFGKGLNE